MKGLFLKEAYQYLGEIAVINTASTSHFMLTKIFENFASINEKNTCNLCLNSYAKNQICALVNLPTEDVLLLSDVLKTYGMN